MPANPEVLEYMDELDPLARSEAPRSRGGKGCAVPEGDGEGDEEQATIRGLVLQVPLTLPMAAIRRPCCYNLLEL